MDHQTAIEEKALPPSTSVMYEKTSDLLLFISRNTKSESVSIGELEDALAERAFGALLLILALPCCIPFLYGVPQAMSLPLVFVAAQIMFGRRKPWLPQGLRNRSFSTDGLRQMIDRAAPYLKGLEVISRSRFDWVTKGVAERLLGVLIMIFSMSIAVPFPMTNTVPGLAVAIMALGFVEKDGLLLLLGSFIGAAWIAFLITLAGGFFALIQEGLNRLT